MKVILIQLPVPNNALSNLPLALGYLKASADAAQLPGLQVELLERVSQDNGGDVFLTDAILAHDPDLVGFSLYTWNSSRALGIARALKAAAPEILILGGGPEVNQDNNFIIGETALDLLVFGEGERTFVELCRYFTQAQPPLEQITGLGYRPNLKKKADKLQIQNLSLTLLNSGQKPETPKPLFTGNWIINSPRLAIEDVNRVPSAYLSGVLEGYLTKFMSIELSRWCPSRCTFCYYGRQDLPRGAKRYFDVSRIKAEIEFGLAHGVEQFHFVEANFNTLPHLDRIFETIRETGANQRAHFYAEMRGEAIDEGEAKRLQVAGFDTVEVGLQSAVPEVLAQVKRKNNLPRLVRGVQLLREHGIEVFLDAILGLPGETPSTFRRTLEFIEQHDLAPYDLFHLQVLAGTQLKAEALTGQHGLVWQDAPPYFVLQTAQLSFADLCALRREGLTRKGDDPAEIAGLPKPDPFALSMLSEVTVWAGAAKKEPLQRLIFDFDEPLPDCSLLARRLASEVTLWLKLGVVNSQKLQQAQRILSQLSQPNPNGVWHIFADSQCPLSEIECEQLLAAIQHEAGYLDRLAVFGLQEPDPTKFKRWPSLNFYNVVPAQAIFPLEPTSTTLIARLLLDNAAPVETWRSLLEQVLTQSQADLLLEFTANIEIAKVQAALTDLNTNGRELWFSDWRVTAGMASQLQSDLSLHYPLSYASPQNGVYQIETPKLDKAALAWTLAQRRPSFVNVLPHKTPS